MDKPVVLEILTIGREILDGRVVDTNSVAIAEILRPLGLVPRFAQRADDEIPRILEAFVIAARRADVVVVTGGLGPTADDLTAEALGVFLGEGTVENPEALAQVKARFELLKRPLSPAQLKQARIPPSCFVLENTQGTAPGFGVRHAKDGRETLWFFLPGVPREMKTMLRERVLPRLPRVSGYRAHTWATQFTSEGELQMRLNAVHARLPAGFEIGYRTRHPENHIGLYGDASDKASAALFDSLRDEITALLAQDVFFHGPETDVPSLESQLVPELAARGWQVASVESCTGGLVASRVTDVPGSSKVFWGSWVVYENRAKEALGVSPALLASQGAVSEECARELAEAGRERLRRMGGDRPCCVATTGIAGPDGGTAEKPVGLCWVACALPDGRVVTERVQGRVGLTRLENKALFAQKALELIRRNR